MDSQASLGDIINSLMQNPEIMKTVSTLAKGQTDTKVEEVQTQQPDGDSAEKTASEGFSIPPELLSSLPQMMSALSSSQTVGKEGDRASQRKELLRALRPFLSEKRCSVIDGILQFEGLAGVLDAFKAK